MIVVYVFAVTVVYVLVRICFAAHFLAGPNATDIETITSLTSYIRMNKLRSTTPLTVRICEVAPFGGGVSFRRALWFANCIAYLSALESRSFVAHNAKHMHTPGRNVQ